VFSSQNILGMGTVAFVLFDNYCLIMDKLDSKDSSCDFMVNCVISFLFRLHLMLHAYAARFDVMFWSEIFWQLNTP
jgi:hypothetical protein